MSKSRSDTKIVLPNELQNKACVVVGTRPGIIKMSPLIRELGKRGINYFVIHTGQHYSQEMDKQFFIDLELSVSEYYLNSVKNYSYHGEQTAEMLVGIEKVLLKEKPKIVFVCGDANTNLAGALAARKLGIKIGHVESGLRSNDWRMPEEHNRVMIDHISEYLYAPTVEAVRNLNKDNVKGKIILTGNTIVDAIKQNLEIAKRKTNIIEELSVKSNSFFIVTVHREENVDYRENLSNISKAIKLISNRYDYPIVFPLHPRTKKRLAQFGLNEEIKGIRGLVLLEPLGYLEFLCLLANCRLAITDSGGIQEESCILKVPCLTLRENTERPETVTVGSNLVVGTDPIRVLKGIKKMLSVKRDWNNPFVENSPTKKIVDSVVELFNVTFA